jgi:hypothetical protein
MSKKMSERLLQELKKAEPEDRQREIPVIVTTKSKIEPSLLEQKGLKITHTFENISAVSGTLTTSKLKDIAELDQVETIEYDGEVRALDN